MTADGSGNFVVVWMSDDQDGSSYGVFGQRFDSVGALVGSEFQVNSSTTSDQRYPAAVADSSGNFVVIWQGGQQDGDGFGVIGQRFDSAGGMVGSEFQVNTYTTSYQRFPAVAADSSGNFVVAWQSYEQDGDYYDVFGQRFDSAGGALGSEFQVNTHTTATQWYPVVAVDGSGNFVVAWDSFEQKGEDRGVFGQRYDSLGSAVGSEFQVNSYTTSHQRFPAVAAGGSGNFVVAWMSLGQDGSDYGVFGQRFDSAGSKVGSEFQANSYATGSQDHPAVAADDSGNFVVAWESFGQDGSIVGVVAQRFDSAGSPVGSELEINSYTTNGQVLPAVAADGSGNFVVAWFSYGQDGSSWGVFGRQLTISIFADGFENEDVCAWSANVGSGDNCPVL